MQFLSEIKSAVFNNSDGKQSLSRYLLKGAAGSFGIQIASILLTLLSNFILTRILGAAEYGTFAYIFTIIFIGGNIATIGLDVLLVRQISAYKAAGDYSKMKGILIFATALVLPASLIISVLLLASFRSFEFLSGIGDIHLFQISLIALPFFAFLLINQAALQGVQKIITGQLPEKIIRSFFFLLITGIVYLLNFSAINLYNLIWVNIVAITVAFVWSAFSFQKNIFPLIKNADAQFEKSQWLKSGFYFLLLNSFYLVNSRIDILMLGAMKTNYEVGIYNIAVRLSDFVPFSLMIVNTVIAPSISNLYSTKQPGKLQRLVTLTARAALLFALPVAVAFIFFGNFFLSIFGNDFANGNTALIYLCLGQMLNVACGSVGNILAMTGNEKFALISMAASLTANIVLNALLIPAWGMNGAALATAISMALWNMLMVFFVIFRTKIHPTVLGKISF